MNFQIVKGGILKASKIAVDAGVLVLFLTLGLLSVLPCRAQLSTTGTVSGTVTDSSGGIVPKAIITVANPNTGVKRSTQSNADGTYIIPSLPVGSYTVTVQKQGFQRFVETNIALHPTTVVQVNAILKVGAITTTVQVSATATQVETSTPEVSNQVSGEQTQTLPLNGRNFESLGSLMPGVTNVSAGSALGGGSDQVGNPLSINGMSQSGTLFTIDGIWNTDSGAMLNLSITPPPESIQEVRVLQNNYGVQYNLFGSNVVMVETKSGTSTFHGDAYEYLRNDALDARNFFSPTVSPLKQNIFGYTLGGPVYIPRHYNADRQKTFFFWSQQWRHQNIASVVQGTTPTTDMRNGLFDHPITNPQTGQPFPQVSPGEYQIPQNMINPDSVALLNALTELPNNPRGGFLNYINLNPQINRQRDDQARIDHNFGSRLRLMGEFFDEHQGLNFPNLGGSPFTTNKFTDTTDSYVAQLQLTQMLSPAMVNTTAIATSQYVDNYLVHGIWQREQVPDFHEVLPFNGFLSNRLPEIDFTGGWSSIGIGQVFPLLHASDLEDSLTDDWSWLHGKHYIQAGGTILFGTKRQPDFAQSNGDWLFTGQFTGDPVADFLLGDPGQLTQASGETRPYSQYPLLSPYAQDRWKATKRLTLSVGLRFLFEPEPHAQRAYITTFDPAKYDPARTPIVNGDGTVTPTSNYDPLNGLIFNGVGNVPLNFTTVHQYYWAPSVGFAWDLFGDGRTSLRGGYGITYTRVPTGSDCSYFCGNNPPRIQTLTLVTPQFPDAVGGTIAPSGAPSLVSEDLNIQSSQVQNYSLSLQHQFRGNWIASIAGAGNVARHIGGYWNRNQPLPDPPYDFNPIINGGTVFSYVYAPYLGYAAINTNTNNMNLYWDALEISVRHPVGHNLFLSANYTWQHGLSNARGSVLFENSNTMQDIYHPGSNYGSTNYNTPNTFGLSAIWTIPWFQSAKGLKGFALGGWKYSDITTLYSGYSLDPGLATATPGLAIRPNRMPGVSLEGPKTVNEWFNPAAFTAPPPGYFGNAGPGIITGPGLVDFDMALYKDFRIKERHTIEFRTEFFNAFNHTNFNGIQTSFGAGNYGQVTSAADPRIIEFGLRYEF